MIIGVDTFLEDFKKNSLVVKILRDAGQSEIEINETLYDFFDGVTKALTNELQKQKFLQFIMMTCGKWLSGNIFVKTMI